MNTLPRLCSIALGGGCHWCTEAVFKSLRGVGKVEQGWISSEGNASSFSEGIIVHYDPSEIQLSDLIEVHLHTHSSQSQHSMRGKYRSAIYTIDPSDTARARCVIADLQKYFPASIVTQVLPFVDFRASKENFLSYYHSNPAKPFCTTYIDPKLQLLQKKFPDFLSESRKSV